MQNELLQKTLKEKEEEIINLKNEIQQKQENNSFNKTFYTREQMIALNFISSDSTLHYAIPCLNKDLFVDVEKKLYDKFPEYKERNNILKNIFFDPLFLVRYFMKKELCYINLIPKNRRLFYGLSI